jgi:Fe2+ or Zn2+ uptake regulation protein
VDNLIIDYLQSSPGLSANKILSINQKNTNRNIIADTIYGHLRKMKKKGIVINQGTRWYLRK